MSRYGASAGRPLIWQVEIRIHRTLESTMFHSMFLRRVWASGAHAFVMALAALLLAPGSVRAQGVTSFQIDVPQRMAAAQITKVKVTLDLTLPATNVAFASGAAGPFAITSNLGTAFTPTWDAGSLIFFAEVASPPALLNDSVVITPPPPGLAAGDPAKFRYELVLNLSSNKPTWTSPTDPEVWTIAYAAGASFPAGAKIVAACLRSYDTSSGAEALSVGLVARVKGTTLPGGVQSCQSDRPPVDAVLVLDKSGSMSSSTTGATPEPKIAALRSAVESFVTAWEGLGTVPNDRLGVVLFDSNASWWSTVGNGLQTFNAGLATTIKNNTNTITTGSSTALGAGAELADGVLNNTPGSPRRSMVILMSDGIQNANRLLGLKLVNGLQTPATYSPATPNAKTELPHWVAGDQRYPIYGVTVGTGAAISAQVFDDMRTATNGGYVNTETEEQLLRPYFVQALQNMLRFNTWETARMVSQRLRGVTPYQTAVPFSSASERVLFTVMSPRRYGALRLSVLVPGEAQPRVVTGQGSLQLALPVPTTPAYKADQPWQVSVSVADASADGRRVLVADGWPFDLSVLVDDHAIKSQLAAAPKVYAAGDRIVLRAQLTEFGRRLVGLGAQAGNRLVVQMIKPGVGVGDLLSDSSASAAPPIGADTMAPAEAKLFNLLQASPGALAPATDQVTLVDDGQAASGDDVAGDGIYSAAIPTPLPGHYNFLFGLEVASGGVARVSRQQLVSVFVRSVPNAGSSSFQTTQVAASGGGQALSIGFTPRVQGGARMGPGWANYFWFKTPDGAAVKPVDRLDGTYVATVPYSGTPPAVGFHFLGGSSTLIADTVQPQNLPAPLDASTRVVEDVTQLGGKRYALWLALGSTFPHSSFSNQHKGGLAATLGFEYGFTPSYAVEATLGRHSFGDKNGGGDIDVTQFGVNGKLYFPQPSVKPFVTVGVGSYAFDPGSTRFGVNLGAGLQVDLAPQWSLEGRYALHRVTGNAPNSSYSTLQLGLRYAF